MNHTPEQIATWPERKPHTVLHAAYDDNGNKLRGVHWDPYNKHFIAKVSHNHQHIQLGTFACPIEAAKARDLKAIELYGDKAVLNFPGEYKVTTSLCSHLLLGGIEQVTIGAAINEQPVFLCLDCAVKHILDMMVVHQLNTPAIDAMLNFDLCGHFDGIQCGCCIGALVGSLTAVAMQNKLAGNNSLQYKIKKLCSLWNHRHGDLNVSRVVLKTQEKEI